MAGNQKVQQLYFNKTKITQKWLKRKKGQVNKKLQVHKRKGSTSGDINIQFAVLKYSADTDNKSTKLNIFKTCQPNESLTHTFH